ncbi:MAG: outer membrane beta-barrel protein [Candidatus Krumholzibacteriota bacterium]
MFKKILFLTLVTAVLCPLTAMGSIYFGAGIGNSWQSATVEAGDVFDEVSEISQSSTGWKIFAGFKSESIFGIEGGYRDLGKVESPFAGLNYGISSDGWDIAAMGHLEIAIIDLFAKAGAFFWSTDSNFIGDDSGTSFLWGLGAGVSLGPVGIRLEWESMEVGSMDNLSMLSLGATFGF